MTKHAKPPAGPSVSQIGSPQTRQAGFNTGLTAADQFNILLFHTSFAENTSAMSSDPELTKTVHVITPKIISKELAMPYPCRFEIGCLYQVVVDSVSFLETESGPRLWPDEWYAKDVFVSHCDIMMFMGLTRYDITNEISKRESTICVLNFLLGERIVQYPVFHYADMNKDTSNWPKRDIDLPNFANSLLTVLGGVLEPV